MFSVTRVIWRQLFSFDSIKDQIVSVARISFLQGTFNLCSHESKTTPLIFIHIEMFEARNSVNSLRIKLDHISIIQPNFHFEGGWFGRNKLWGGDDLLFATRCVAFSNQYTGNWIFGLVGIASDTKPIEPRLGNSRLP